MSASFVNEYQQKLYDDLMALSAGDEAFFHKDFFNGGHSYRIFNYRLASYTQFLLPSALESRGIMFKMSGFDRDISLASLPMEKFFNLNENPMTMGLDLSTIVEAESKADGSLISTYVANRGLWLKSKGSIESDQCIGAMGWLQSHQVFYNQLLYLAAAGYTINMEWCSPSNRIVLPYDTSRLIVLNVRRHSDGAYMTMEDLFDEYIGEIDEIEARVADRLTCSDWNAWANQIVPNETGVEGYVIRMESGQRVKIKTPWYMALHHTKDSINSPRRLFEAVIEEATDDMRSLFHDDPQAIALIAEMEEWVDELYNHMVSSVEAYHAENKDLERKEYAIKGQAELKKMYFGLAMQKYLGKEPDYKAFIKSKWKDLGLKDREEVSDEDSD